jgi:hypothetical protein
MLLLFLILATIVLAQPSPPAQGIQIGDPLLGVDIRFPLTVTQCEPVFIFCNITIVSSSDYFVYLQSPDFNSILLYIGPTPLGVHYFEWVCNIPAGYGFWAGHFGLFYVIVQPGPSSSCLHNVTTTYQYASYSTVAFASYTAGLPITTTSSFPPGFLAT